MSASEPPAKIWYEANCHCGAIQYKVLTSPLETQEVTNCNCSICCKNGYLNIYPKRTDVVFHRGQEHMKGYLFGEKKCMHKFCPTCGSSLVIDPHMDDAESVVVNVRMFKDIDVDKLKLWKYDGFNRLQPRYKVNLMRERQDES